ncbi:DotD/TraH family lipoprotein [Pseudovibrio ascidiaceicola]|uniref:DotD/TraH family lipoprotein n=1 Tax=Pseudovibrio ascidiaceicola TaxID=285279 RepID=UPI003D35FC5C
MKPLQVFSVMGVVVFGLGLTACSTTPPAQQPVSPPVNSQVDEMLAGAVVEAANAQSELARVQAARTKITPSMLDTAKLPAELKSVVTLKYSGPGAQAAERIAGLVGYSFKTNGNHPSIEPMVHINALNEPAGKVLEDIGFQSFPQAEVALDPNAKKLEYRYLQAQSGPHASAVTSGSAFSAQPASSSITK